MATNTFTVGGHVFTINWSTGLSRRLAAVGVKACNAGDMEYLFALFNDSLKLSAALWAVVGDKAKSLGIETQEQFEDLLGGEELQAGFAALVESFIRFAPADVRSAMWHAAKEFYAVVRKASEEFISETTDMPTPEVAVA